MGLASSGQGQVGGLVQGREVAALAVLALPQLGGLAVAALGLEQLGALFQHWQRLRLLAQPLQRPGALALFLPDLDQPLAPGRVPGFGQALVLQQVAGLQALGQHQPGLGIILGRALAQLLEGRIRVVPREPFDGLQAGAAQFVAEAAHGVAIVLLAGQFPVLQADRRVGLLGRRQAQDPALGLVVAAQGDGPLDHRPVYLMRRLGAGRLLEQSFQLGFVQVLHVGVGQALPAFGVQLPAGGQRFELGDGVAAVAQLLGPVGPGLAQFGVVALGRQLCQPVVGALGAAGGGQAQAIGLPQLGALGRGSAVEPALHFLRGGRILVDPGQVQVQ